MNKNQKGFGTVEGLLLFVILGIVVLVGWYVYNAKNSTDKTVNSKPAKS